jgi:hypothetical protein
MTEPKPFTLKELDGVSVTSFIRVAANVIVAAGIFPHVAGVTPD